jgi:hypothetical protein
VLGDPIVSNCKVLCLQALNPFFPYCREQLSEPTLSRHSPETLWVADLERTGC